MSPLRLILYKIIYFSVSSWWNSCKSLFSKATITILSFCSASISQRPRPIPEDPPVTRAHLALYFFLLEKELSEVRNHTQVIVPTFRSCCLCTNVCIKIGNKKVKTATNMIENHDQYMKLQIKSNMLKRVLQKLN